MAQVNDKPQWRFKGPEMEGPIARWYTRLRSSGSQMEEYRRQASRLTDGLPTGTAVLEVAPGPGYLAIEMTRRPCFSTGTIRRSSPVRAFSSIPSIKGTLGP